jgi:chorismate mutase
MSRDSNERDAMPERISAPPPDDPPASADPEASHHPRDAARNEPDGSPDRGTSNTPSAPAAERVDGKADPPSIPVLDRLRGEIARVDAEILRLVGERVAIAREVGAVKARSGLPILDPRREAAVVRSAAESAREKGLPEDEIRQLFWQLIGLCRRAQQAGSRGE